MTCIFLIQTNWGQRGWATSNSLTDTMSLHDSKVQTLKLPSFNTTLLHVLTSTTTDWQTDKTGDQQLQMIYKQDEYKSYKYYMLCISLLILVWFH